MAHRRLNSLARPHPLRGAAPTAAGQPPTFNNTVANLYEEIGDGPNEVSKAGFSPEGGKSQRAWQITPANFNDLVAAFPAILGACNYAATGTGKLARTLPVADPVYPWMYASSIPTVDGYGTAAKTAADATLEAPAFPYGSLWDHYRLSVESMPRPFPILPDSSVGSTTGKWYPETGGGTAAATYTVANEQNRYCTWDFQPQADYVTMQRGRLEFDAGDIPKLGLNAMPRIYLPNQLYTVVWYNVPVRLVLSSKSYLKRWLGRINQNAFRGPDRFLFGAGELLYLNFGMKAFTPPVQAVVALSGESGGSVISTEKFANITMTFLYTTRKNVSPPVTPPANKNFVAGGHNLLPRNDGNFRYARLPAFTAYTPTLPYQPSWLSAPLETLWTDPDSPGGVP